MRGGGSPDGNYAISGETGDEAVFKRVMTRYNKAKGEKLKFPVSDFISAKISKPQFSS